MTLRIAILLANNDTSEFARHFPDDAQKVRQRLAPLRPDWHFESVAIKDGTFPASVSEFDGYVITGSPASVNQPLAWIKRLTEFILELDSARIPTVGLCFGHQAIAAALGGKVENNPHGWGLGVGHTSYSRFEPWMQPPCERVVLYAAHNEQVTAPPPRARVLGGDASCPVGAFAVDNHFFTTEYHPELSAEFMAALVDHLAAHIDPEVIRRARQQLSLAVDHDLYAQWMVNFLEWKRP